MGYPSKRRIAVRDPSNTVLVVAEGWTERIFFQGLRVRKSTVNIVVPRSHPTDALGLVRLCTEHMKMKDIDIELGDLAICAFDIEGNDARNLSQAIRIARDSGILLAMTNPCFELWFLMHFRDVMPAVSCAEVHRCLKDHIDGYRKTEDYRELLGPLRNRAMDRALRTWGEGNEGSIPSNPGTTMHIVLSKIDGLVQRNARSRSLEHTRGHIR